MSGRRRRALGFTLIEMMVAVLVGTTGVILAAKVAQVILRQSSKGRQSTDFHGRARLVTRQLRADLRAAGVGATGAVGVDAAIPAWASMSQVTAAGFAAIPVVAGANAVGGAVGARTVAPSSDAIQIVVTDPKTSVRTLGFNPSGQDIIGLDPGAPTLNCPSGMIYAVDHTTPTGQGRAQLFFVDAYVPGAINTTGQLQFTLGAGSEVMCARVSVYWVDDTGWLHRSDLSGAGAPLVNLGGAVWVDSTNAATDGLSPGVLDLQIAYQVSAEVYRSAGAAPPVGQAWRMWAFEGVAGNADAFMNAQAWFEVRMVRANFLMRTMRRIEVHGATRDIVRREDGAALPPLTLTRALAAEWAVATEDLTNQRFFDLGAPAGAAAEPY